MKKLIRDAIIHYEIRNLTTNKRTGKTAPSSKRSVTASATAQTSETDTLEAPIKTPIDDPDKKFT